MVIILISRLLESYKHFLETLQLTDKLEELNFDKLRELLADHDKKIGKKKKLGEGVLVASASKNNTKVSNEKGVFLTKGTNNQ
jgi:hypothetical protein